MVRFQIQALERQGLKGRFRAGRHFPSAEAVAVVVHDSQEDPPYEGDPKQAHIPPFHIGKASFKAIMEDKKLRVIPEGDPLRLDSVEVQRLRASFERAWDDIKRTHAFELEAEAAKRHDAELRIAELEAEQVKTYEKLAELQALGEKFSTQKAELDKQVADLRGQLAELEGDHTPAEIPAAKKAQHGKQAKEGSHRG